MASRAAQTASGDTTQPTDRGDTGAGGSIDDLVAAINKGNPRAEARALSVYESADADEAKNLLDALALAAAADSPYALSVVLAIVDTHHLLRSPINHVIGAGTSRHENLREDIQQAALIALARSIHQFRGDAKFRTWLFALARNTAVSELRRLKPTVVYDPDNGGPRLAPGQTSRRISSLVTEENLIETLIGELPVSLRETVYLRDVQRLSYLQIAEQQSLTINTVKSRLSRGRSLLAKLWAESGADGHLDPRQ